ncbi:MAG: 16S rRNA (guanine(527)-N(7))-methyltransferase RsmG [Candidatus Thiodiazotropha sp.]
MRQIRFDEKACRERLQAGVEQLAISLSGSQMDQLIHYLALLHKWNKAYNLTAVRDPLEMVSRHLLDSLAVLPYFNTRSCLDMGTGAGLPGIPLAILCPRTRFVLLDSNSKKVRFLRQVILELGLDNVTAVHARLEALNAEEPFPTLISRAFTDLPNMLQLASALMHPGCELLAMKGRVPDSEITALPPDYDAEIRPLQVPFCDAERCLVRIRRKNCPQAETTRGAEDTV